MGRLLGMSEGEFWSSTLAKVTALYRLQVLEWNRTRDFYPAHLLAGYLTSKGATGQTGQGVTGEEMLLLRYPREKPEQKIDPDLGAAGGWRHLKAALKGQ